MDGTLIDQTSGIINCYRKVIRSLGQPEPDDQSIRRSLGGPMADTMALFVAKNQLDDACRAFRHYFPEVMYEGLVILPGALELIEYFHGTGTPQAIFTNKHGDTARQVSHHCDFDRFITTCIGNTDTPWAKPDPRLTRHVLSRLNASTKGACLIGDSPTDVATATAAGIPCYTVATGAHSEVELMDAGASAAFDNLLSLKNAFA